MYELKNGSARLVGALERYADDSARLKALAQILNYQESQLKQDIKALVDYYQNSK